MNDFKVTLNRRQEHFLARLLPKGYSFEQYKVRKNINDYPFKEFDRKYKRTESMVLSKKESMIVDSVEFSERSMREKSEVPSVFREQFTPLQVDLLELIRKLRKHESSYPFRSPVDPKALQIPDYFDVVLEPIDLKTIEEQIRNYQYQHVSQFERDIYKMIMNSYKFNQKLTTTYNKTIQFEAYFVETMREWERARGGERSVQREDRELVKEEVVDYNAVGSPRQEEGQRRLEGFNLWNWSVKEGSLQSAMQSNLVGQQCQAHSGSQRKQPKLLKVLTEMAEERSRVSRKRLPKIEEPLGHLARAQQKEPEPAPVVVKKEQPEVSAEQQQESAADGQANRCLSQPLESSQPQIKNQEQEQQILSEMGDFLENQTVKEQNCSEGYNEFISGYKIRNNQVQKQITGLLKRLNEFPLTKQKKNKLFSKFTNLEQSMTQSDKKKLLDKITKLDENDIEYVIRILTRGKPDLSKNEEFQIDLDKADSKVLREIQNFIAIRDNSLVLPVENGALPLSVSQSLETIRLPKKVKKEEKKLIKKKLSRKNSNDDSFSLNPPQIKKKKSEKPLKKYPRDQLSQNGDVNSVNDEKSESSYHPEPMHHIRMSTSQPFYKNPEIQKNPQTQKQKLPHEQKKKPEPKPESSSRFDPNQIFINSNPQPSHHQPAYHYDQREIYDIDQFLVSSKHLNDPESSPEHGLFTSARKKRRSIDPLDFIYDPNFQFGQSGIKDYPEEEIREFSMDEPRKEHNDDDQFF